MFKRIIIDNFRGIKHIEIDQFQQINLLVGKNNSGKSTILEAIFLNIGAMNTDLPLRINAFRNYERIDDITFRSFFHNLEINNPIRIYSSLEKPRQKRELIIKPHLISEKNGKVIDIENILSSEDSSESKQRIDGLEHRLKLWKNGNKSSKTHTAFLKQEGVGARMIQPSNYKETLSGTILTSRIFPLDNAKRLARIQFEKNEKKLIHILQQIEPELTDIKILDKDYIFADINKKNLIPIAFLGDGINRLLSYLLAIYENPDSVILIDEIENGFHHKSLNVLWKAIFSASKELNVQIFATTHSWENVKSFSEVANQFKDRFYKVYRIESHAGQNKIVAYEPSLLQQSVESEWEIR